MKKNLNNLLKPVKNIPAAQQQTGKLIHLIIKRPNDYLVSKKFPLSANHHNFSSNFPDEIYADLFDLPGSDWGFEQEDHSCLDTMVSVQARNRSIYHINY